MVAGFECGIEYASGGRGNFQQVALNAIKGFLAVSLFTIVPVRLYTLSVSLQGTFTTGISNLGIGELGASVLEGMDIDPSANQYPSPPLRTGWRGWLLIR